MKCKDCVFYTGVKCHGHGEFWGECQLVLAFVKFNNFDYKNYDVWSGTKWDDSPCIFNEILKLKNEKKEIK